MSEVGKDTPGWWQSWTQDALTFVARDHGIGEAILGIGKLIEEGKNEEAKKLSLQASTQIDILRANPNMKGEIGSSQLASMLANEKYPQHLQELICSKIPEMKSYLPKKEPILSEDIS